MADYLKIDGQKLIYHPARVAGWLEAEGNWENSKKVYPIYMEISPSGGCNHRCTFCALDYMEYKPRFLDVELMRKVIPEMSANGVKSIMFGGEGEPLFHKDIALLSKTFVDEGIEIAFTTNGVLLNEKLAEKLLPVTSWIKVSIDAGTAQTYSRVHNTKEDDFYKLISNLKEAVKLRREEKLSCAIGAQLLLLPENACEIKNLAILCRDEIGLDYLVIKPYSQHMLSNTHKYSDIEYSNLLGNLQNIEELSSNNFKIICRFETIQRHITGVHSVPECNAVPFFWAYMASDHSLYACGAKISDDRFNLGNLKTESFREIWEGEKRRKLSEIMQDFDINECRMNCRMNSINEYLWTLKHPGPHVNFI